jgi:hypothetical protein
MAREEFSVFQERAFNPGLWSLLRELRRMLADCRTVLDIGCGCSSPLRYLSVQELVGIEGHGPTLEAARKNRTHDEVVPGDVRKLRELFPARRFDACVALDLIEHLPKEDGWRLLADLEQLAARRIVIFTPSGFLPQKGHDDLQEHQSGWSADEMRRAGYRVIGMHGLKSLRGEYHALRHRPKAFWAVVSWLSQIVYARRHPERAAAILCVKALDGTAGQPVQEARSPRQGSLQE